MNGFLVTFFTLEGRLHHGKAISRCLIDMARRIGICGVTEVAAIEGYGHHGKFHSARFFELADRPIEVSMACTDDELQRLFAEIRKERMHVFYVKSAVEFGSLGEEPNGP